MIGEIFTFRLFCFASKDSRRYNNKFALKETHETKDLLKSLERIAALTANDTRNQETSVN